MTVTRQRLEPGPFCIWVQHANHSATEPSHVYFMQACLIDHTSKLKEELTDSMYKILCNNCDTADLRRWDWEESLGQDWKNTRQKWRQQQVNHSQEVSIYPVCQNRINHLWLIMQAMTINWSAAAGPYSTICTSLQTDNHTNTPSLNFYRPDALPDARPTVSKHWRPVCMQRNAM